METILTTLLLALLALTFVKAADSNYMEENEVLEAAGTDLFGSISSSQPSSYNDGLGDFPYEGPREPVYDTFAVPQPTFGVSINTKAILGPQVEILRLVEGFIQLFGDIVARFQSLINDNYDLIRAIVNIFVKKISFFQNFSLKGISVIRKVLEIFLNLFANFSVTLPSITIGATGGSDEPQHAVYGVPPSYNTTNFS